MSEENSNGHFNLRCKAQSTSQLLSADTVMIKSISSSPSPASSTSSLSSKTNLSSFLKIPLPNRKSTTPQPTEDRFVMTIIKSPSSNSQRISSTSSSELSITTPSTAITTNEDISNNGKFFKNKVTAAFNHMKYRKSDKFEFFRLICLAFSIRLGRKNATEFSNE